MKAQLIVETDCQIKIIFEKLNWDWTIIANAAISRIKTLLSKQNLEVEYSLDSEQNFIILAKSSISHPVFLAYVYSGLVVTEDLEVIIEDKDYSDNIAQ
ncbi:hypothetical protein [Laspinema olomoucense]|uniref:hypothetical protein n=1 Tax=Laspinema olomoucense TaxID=3231600 RepID=UPI0021BB3880|nr:hypothetical protein [Laspinema sp. D3d]MCT7971124.1 hypothetical protein [Laspinema sp. D3d]